MKNKSQVSYKILHYINLLSIAKNKNSSFYTQLFPIFSLKTKTLCKTISNFRLATKLHFCILYTFRDISANFSDSQNMIKMQPPLIGYKLWIAPPDAIENSAYYKPKNELGVTLVKSYKIKNFVLAPNVVTTLKIQSSSNILTLCF